MDLRSARYRLSLRARNLVRMGMGWLQSPDVVLIGEYHGANLGDVALSYAVSETLRGRGLSSQCQTLHSLPLWKHQPGVPAIVGGGNVLNDPGISLLEKRYAAEPQNLSFLGVDFNFADALLPHRDFLNRVKRLTFRSAAQAARVRDILGREDVIAHPDLAFALKGIADSTPKPRGGNGKTLGFNLLPLYLTQQGGEFVPVYKPSHPNQAQFARETAAYLTLIQRLIAHYRERGYRLIHFPFAVEDDLFARSLFATEPGITFRPFSPSVQRGLADVKRCDLFLSTRFHALVFALVCGVPCVPVSYAHKCLDLLHDAEITAFDPLFIRALTDEPEAAFRCATTTEPLTMPASLLNQYQSFVTDVIQSAL